MHETQVWSLGQEDPPEKEMATHSTILAWKINPKERDAWQAVVHGIAKSQIRLSDKTAMKQFQALMGPRFEKLHQQSVSLFPFLAFAFMWVGFPFR